MKAFHFPNFSQKSSVPLSRSQRLMALTLILIWVGVLLRLQNYLPMQATSWMVFLGLVVAPGYFLADIVLWKLNLDGLERLATTFPFGVVAIMPAGLTSMLLHLTVHTLALLWAIVAGLIIVIWLIQVRWLRHGEAPVRSKRWAFNEIVWVRFI